MATFLQVIQSAQNEMGLNRAGSALGSTDPGVQQLAALLNSAGMELVKEHPWQVLQREHTFATAAGTATYSLPEDYDRFIPDSGWDRTQSHVLSMVSPQVWAWSKAENVGTSFYYRWRVKANQIYLDPTPTAVHTVAIEYMSNGWVQASDGSTTRPEATADDDDVLLDFRLLVDLLKLRWFEIKGFDTRALEASYLRRLNNTRATDVPAPAITMGGGHMDVHLIDDHNLADTGYGT